MCTQVLLLECACLCPCFLDECETVRKHHECISIYSSIVHLCLVVYVGVCVRTRTHVEPNTAGMLLLLHMHLN